MSSSPSVCIECGLTYAGWQWCRSGESCTFCKNYAPADVSRGAILRDARDRYLMSGMTQMTKFVRADLPYVAAWCERFDIPNTPEAERSQAALLAERDWSRVYWH
jgi:hypothetical protein